VLTSGTVYLADILFCESALFYFSEVSVSFWVWLFYYYSLLSSGKDYSSPDDSNKDTSNITKKLNCIFFWEKMH